ncbi:hypothetical protein [Selenomonas ruminantium]|uniref:hypothetical protein n=1 Tax=Selenomonas ruminantium TaxID=971 RepID=UPI0026F011CD|nr:hypothetical protein [Selenomonas ruminantium]
MNQEVQSSTSRMNKRYGIVSIICSLVLAFMNMFFHDMMGIALFFALVGALLFYEANEYQLSLTYFLVEKMTEQYNAVEKHNQNLSKFQADTLALERENKRLAEKCRELESKIKTQNTYNEQYYADERYLYAMRGILIRNKDKLTDEIIVHNDDGYDDPNSYIIDIELLKYPKLGHYKATKLSG